MRALKVAASLVATYGIVVLGNGLFYSWWSGDSSEMLRMVVRVLGSGLVAYGLWTRAKWGWWCGVLFSGLLSLIGALALAAAFLTDLLESRPYPTVDLLFFFTALAVLAAAFVCIMLPESRDAFRSRTGSAS